MPRGKTPPIHVARFATSFVGREALLVSAAQALTDHRLVTLLGPPGVGKSRLAAELVARSPDRAAWCDLAGAKTADDIAARLADAAGARLVGDRRAIFEALGAAIGASFDRVVLDTAESAQPELASFLLDLLAAAPAARFLIVSSVRIGAPGEALLEVPPLDVSPSGEAEQLFLERARLVRPDLTLDAAGRADLQALLRSLDGLPLAIELAAARSRFSPIRALAAAMLSPGRMPAQNPLWAALERSLSELSPPARDAFAKLSVFRDGFSLEAAEEVLSGSEEPVIEALSELADRSLLSVQHTSGSTRFSMLNAVRAVAESLVGAEASAGLRARHAAFFAGLSERCAREDADDSARIVAQLTAERDNVAAALEWSREARAPERLALALAWAVIHKGIGPISAIYTELEAALAASPDAPIGARARVAGMLTRVARDLDRCADVVPLLQELLETTEGDPVAHAIAKTGLGEALTASGRFDEGARALWDARELERHNGRPIREARVLYAFGINRLEAGRLGEARLALREALARLEGRDSLHEARMLVILGVIEIEEGRLQEAKTCLTRALAIAEQGDDRRLFALATSNWAALLHESGDIDAAAIEYERSAELSRAAGMRRGEAISRAFQGHCHIERGNFGKARAAYEEALVRLGKEGWRRTMVLAPYAAAMAMEGETEMSARMFDEAESTIRAMGQERIALSVEVWRGFSDLAEARRLRALGDLTAASQWAEAARRRALSTLVDPNPQPVASGGPALAQQSTDLRIALRSLRRALKDFIPADEIEAAWEVAPDGSLVVSPGGERSDLTRRAALRRVVARLASERIERPGSAVSVGDLVRAGWPGEEVTAKGGADRVYAAVATLRKLGLSSLLQSAGEGYRFDPAAPLKWNTKLGRPG